jgi:hypothetical protein
MNLTAVNLPEINYQSMKKFLRNKILLAFTVAIGLFLVNNILLGAFVPRMPGGSDTGLTTMLAISWISLHLKKPGIIPFIYLIYGLIGLPSHLAVGDSYYFAGILLLVLSAAVFDILLYFGRYKIASYILIFPLFVASTKFTTQYFFYLKSDEWAFPDLKDSLLSLLFGYGGIFFGYLIHNYLVKTK